MPGADTTGVSYATNRTTEQKGKKGEQCKVSRGIEKGEGKGDEGGKTTVAVRFATHEPEGKWRGKGGPEKTVMIGSPAVTS